MQVVWQAGNHDMRPEGKLQTLTVHVQLGTILFSLIMDESLLPNDTGDRSFLTSTAYYIPIISLST